MRTPLLRLDQSFDFGKYEDKTIAYVLTTDRAYFKWIHENEVAFVSKEIMDLARCRPEKWIIPHWVIYLTITNGRQFEHHLLVTTKDQARKWCEHLFNFNHIRTYKLIKFKGNGKKGRSVGSNPSGQGDDQEF